MPRPQFSLRLLLSLAFGLCLALGLLRYTWPLAWALPVWALVAALLSSGGVFVGLIMLLVAIRLRRSNREEIP